jgi:hypothetical protein
LEMTIFEFSGFCMAKLDMTLPQGESFQISRV